jgi:hypothetical protein
MPINSGDVYALNATLNAFGCGNDKCGLNLIDNWDCDTNVEFIGCDSNDTGSITSM